MKKITQFLLIITLLAALLAGCAPAASAPQAITLTDGLGRTVTLDQPAERIVSLAPSATEILFAVGAGDQRGAAGRHGAGSDGRLQPQHRKFHRCRAVQWAITPLKPSPA